MGLFNFKQFIIRDDKASMKVGTDAVLLGAWADVASAKKILDIGAGTGVITLMAAQRNQNAEVVAVEIQLPDFEELFENVRQSPWHNRIHVCHSSIQDYKSEIQFDCIICNPPFFSKSLLPPVESRQKTRHNVTLTQKDLVESVKRLLASE